MQVLRVLSLPTSRHHLAGLAGINNKKKTTKWKQQLTMALGPDNVLGVRRGDRSNKERLDDVFLPGLQ